MNVKRLGAVVSSVLLSMGFAGCGGSSSPSGPGDNWAPASWEAAVGVTSGHPGSVKITAERLDPAHPLYPCLNEAELCFNFGEWGDLANAWYPDEEPRFERLCPSSDFPESDWKFTYEIHAEANCHGEVLNDEYHHNNLVCFDAGALTDRYRDENFTIERLEVGENENSVLCLSRNSNKDWDFTICEDLTPDEDLMSQHTQPHDPDIVLDCGCYPDDGYSTFGRGGGHGPKKNPLCYIFPWLHFCHDGGGGHGGGEAGHGGGEAGHGGGGEGGTEPSGSCVCDFDVDTLPEGCAPRFTADCLITCDYD